MNKTVEIIAVGTELLMGQITNTNAAYISDQLASLGFNVRYHTVVGDNPDRIGEALKIALKRADYLVFTGGLGPTDDDITKEILCKTLDIPLVVDLQAAANMRQYFDKIGRAMPECNNKQPLVPSGHIVLQNMCGTAPGCAVKHEGKWMFLLPGPPFEMKPMLEQVKQILLEEHPASLHSTIVHLFDIGESTVQEKLGGLFKNVDPTVAPYAKDGILTLRVSSTDESKIAKMVEFIKEQLSDYIFHVGAPTTLPKFACEKLLKKQQTLAIAESCTGGLLGKLITDYPGISSVYKGGFLVYSNELKEKILGIPHTTLATYGAVSTETARGMAVNTRELTNSDTAIAITGIAGPSGGSTDKPVGTVFISVATRDRLLVKELHLAGTRENIRKMAALHALWMLCLAIDGYIMY